MLADRKASALRDAFKVDDPETSADISTVADIVALRVDEQKMFPARPPSALRLANKVLLVVRSADASILPCKVADSELEVTRSEEQLPKPSSVALTADNVVITAPI
jgi:hypothetical protein